MKIEDIRREYGRDILDVETVDPDPVNQFRVWFKDAMDSEMLEPNAMILATTGTNLQPTTRTVLLKAFDKNGFVFYTNYESRKSKQITENSKVSLLFPWFKLERQLIIQGTASKISKAESLKYFMSRPLGSQLGAWVSKQSSIISSRNLLDMKLREMKQKFKEGKVPLPEFWGGYRVAAHTFEFWQGQPNRLHDRIQYTRDGDHWKIERLAP